MPSDEDSFENEMTSRRPANISVVGAEVMKEMLAARRHNLGMEAEAFPRLMRRLRALLQSYYPPHFLAVLAGWGLRTAVGPRGVGNRTMIDGIFQHHVELLQAIALSMPSWEWGEEARRPHGWTRIAADLLSVGDLETQTECAESFEDLRLQALSLERGADQVNGFFMSAELRDDVVVVFHAFSRAMRDTKKDAVRALAEHALAQSGRSRCLFVSRMVETWEVVPYDTIGIFQAR